MSSSARLILVKPWEVPFWWDLVYADLERAIAHNKGESGMDDLWKSLVTGSHTLWVVYDPERFEIAISFTSFINDYPKRRAMFVVLLAGRGFKKYAELEPQLVEYAKSSGCTTIEAFVIPQVAGIVERALPEYKTTHNIMVKEL
jgi:hypothetical protein